MVFERLWPLAALPILLILLRAGGRSRPTSKLALPASKLALPGLRLAAVALILLAACGVLLPIGRGRQALVVVVDRSASVAGGAPTRLEVPSGWQGQLAGWDSVALVEFAHTPAVASPSAPPPLPSAAPAKLDPSATDVEAALRLALSVAPGGADWQGQLAGPTVVLLSDGRETRGDARRAIADLRARHGTLHAWPIAPAEADVAVDRVSAPAEVAEGASVPVEVAVRATRASCVKVTLSAAGSVLAEREGVDVSPGREARLTFTLDPLKVPVLVVEAHVAAEAPDPWPENDSAAAVVRRAGKPKVLLVAEPGRRLEHLLRASGAFDLRVTTSLAGHEAYDAVVFDDRPAEGLSGLGPYVREMRGGLVVSGGPRSFGPGGYAGTDLEGLLPVWCLPQEAFSLVVLLDASGSMAEGTTGATKYETALAALDAVQEVLRPGDRVELVRFADAVASEGMTPARQFPSILARARRESPAGPTALLPALERGAADLEKETSPRRHLLVVTDGELAPGEVGSKAFGSLADRLTRIGAGRTVLVTGARPSEKDLRMLGGRYLPLERLEDLPRLLREELVAARRLVEEAPEAPSRVAGDPMLPGAAACPAVGRDRVTTKEGARADFAFADGGPFFAGWQAGTGRVAAIATTLEKPWGDGWKGDDAAAIWVGAVRWAIRPPGLQGASWEVRDGRVEVRVPGPFRRLMARLVSGSLPAVDVSLDATGRERYAAPLPELPSGACGIEVREGDSAIAAGELVVPVGGEWRTIGVDRARLEAWARLGGGRVIEGSLPSPPPAARGGRWRADGWIAGVAVVLLFADALRKRRG